MLDFPRNINYASIQFQKISFSLCILGSFLGNYDTCTLDTSHFRRICFVAGHQPKSLAVMRWGLSRRSLQAQDSWKGSNTQTKYDACLLPLMCFLLQLQQFIFSLGKFFAYVLLLSLPPYLKSLETYQVWLASIVLKVPCVLRIKHNTRIPEGEAPGFLWKL